MNQSSKHLSFYKLFILKKDCYGQNLKNATCLTSIVFGLMEFCEGAGHMIRWIGKLWQTWVSQTSAELISYQIVH